VIASMRAWLGLALSLCVCLAGCGGGGGGSSSTPSTPTPSVTATSLTTLSVESRQSGILYPVSVYMPADAATGPPPPVIYVLDAETRFGPLLDVLQRSGVRAALVGVGNTGDTRRQVDFLEPGADPYYQFLVNELFPAVESRFRVDPARRVLSGHSSGGLFCMYALFKEAPANHVFTAFICADGSFWQQPDTVSQAEGAMYAANLGHDLPLTVVMGGDQLGNLAYMAPLYQQIVSRDYPGLRISEHAYAMGHVQMDAPFFNDALPLVFPAGR
jgi:enterochelin esterase-like enzyme